MIQAILLAIILALTVYYGVKKRSKLDLPGPRGLPFIGYGPFLGKEPYKAYIKLAEKYGPIFKVQLGSREWVILNNQDLIREVGFEIAVAPCLIGLLLDQSQTSVNAFGSSEWSRIL